MSAKQVATDGGIIALLPTEIIADRKWNSRKEREQEPDADGKVWTDEELDTSIRESGLLQAVRVRKMGAAYVLVFGFRRLSACLRVAPTKPIPCSVMPSAKDELADDLRARFENLTENINRKNVPVPDTAEAFWNLKRLHGSSPREIADKVGLSEEYVERLIRLRAKLSPELWEAWSEHPDRFTVTDLLAVCSEHPMDQQASYNARIAQRRGGRPKGSRKAKDVDGHNIGIWLADIRDALRSERDAKRRAYLEGARSAFRAVESGEWSAK